MAEVTQITDYDSVTLDKTLAQYAAADKLQNLVKGQNKQANDLEAALFEIRNLFWIGVAGGDQLDVLGAIWGIPRAGLTDSQYRTRIIQSFGLNNSGEPEAIIATLKVLWGATYVYYFPAYPAVPAAYYLLTDSTITSELLKALSPAGVEPSLLFPVEFEDGTPVEFEDGSYVYFVG